MLIELRVADLGVIEDLSLVFGPGMTALTGETGAGKTLLIEAIELLMGGRADGTLVRTGASEAVVEGRFARGDEEVVLRRVVPAAGRSRAYIDGQMATAAELAAVGADLVDLHGQHSHQSLLATAVQRRALDQFGGIDLGPLNEARAALAEVERSLAGLGGDAGARAREMDLLRFQQAELAGAELTGPDEDERLEAEEDVLRDAVGHRESAAAALAALAGNGLDGSGGAALDALGVARAALDGRAPYASVVGRLRAAEAELVDVAAELRQVAEGIEDDPARLDELRERRQLLHELVRKYGTATGPGDAAGGGRGTLGDVIAYAGSVDERLEELSSHDSRAAEFDSQRTRLMREIAALEADVRAARVAAAPRLAQAVAANLADLAMAGAQIEVSVGDQGAGDDVRFLLAANKGSALQPLTKVASGGELARAMLALRLVLSSAPPTLVFDEVDAGIGGSAALAVGRSLAAIGADHQVFVVTHLPQVAAFADAQVNVTKGQEGGHVVSRAVTVDGADRVVELSRMLSGSPDSAVARDHAEELLTTVARERGR